MRMSYILKAIADELKTVFGRKTKDKVYSSHHQYDTEAEAQNGYNRAVEKLFNVDEWSHLPGITSTFQLHDRKGNRKLGNPPVKGDYIRILLPGPLPENWVKVKAIEQAPLATSLIVSPSLDPQEEHDKDIEHFFIDEATSRFKVERQGTELRAYEIGKNEGINNKGADAGHRNFLNTMVAEGAWAGFQKIQWEKLTDYLTHKIESKKK